MAIDKNKIIEAATKYVQKGQYDKAIKEYNKLLEADPRDARIQQKLGELYQKKGENNLAADCFLKVAESYSADGFFLKAVAVYKQVLKLNPGLISVNLKLAELHQQLGLMSDAMAQFQLVANHYDKVGDIKSSLDILRRMVDLDPDNIASRIKLAELYAREQMNAEAVGEFRHCAEYLKRNNRVDDYLKVAERLVFLDPSDLELTRELASIYLAKQDTKRALAKLQLCFKADPRDVETLSMLAQAFRELGQISKTVSVYKELAKIYDEQDRVDDERAVWRKILELAPDDPDAQARTAPRQAAAPAPAPVAAPSRAAAAPSAPARAGAAAPAAPITPEQIAKLLTETDVYVKYGLHDKAVDHLKKVFAADPESLDAHEKAIHLYSVTNDGASYLGYLLRTIRLCIARGELDRARPHLQRLCEKEPTHPEVQGFLEAVGGLAPMEEEAEIEDEAILVDAAEEVVEVSDEPENALPEAHDFSMEPLTDDEPLVSSADDEVLAVAADSFDDTEAQVIAEPEDEFLVESPADGIDELALSAATDGDDELVASDGLEDEPLVMAADPADDLALEAATADEELIAAPFGDEDPFGDDGGVETRLDNEPGGYDSGEEDFHQTEEPTRMVDLNALMAQAAAQPQLVEEPEEEPVERTQVARIPTAPEPVAVEPLEQFDEPIVDAVVEDEGYAEAAAEALAEDAPAEEAPSAEEAWADAPAAEEEQAAEEPDLDEFDEAAFFIDQGELEEARDILETVLIAYPQSKRAQELMAQLEAKERGDAAPADEAPAESAEASEPAGGDAAFDLAAELAAEDFGDLGLDSGPQQSEEDFQYSVEDVFEEFKKGVQKVVKPEDVDTHYDLGIAYKEMGLIDDAISEFEQALKGAVGKKKEIECLSMIGIARIEKGEFGEAIKAYKRGLGSDLVTAETAKALNFEIGAAYEKLGDLKGALLHFLRVQKNDPKYRDVGSAVENLRSQLSDEDLAEVDSSAAEAPAKAAAGGAAPAAAPAPQPPGPAKVAASKSRKIGYV